MDNKQEKLGLKVEQNLDSVEKYVFEPIKGYPMLNWKGKRPFSATQFYPAQLKENHGEDVKGWMNKIFWGDNLQVMSHLLKEYRGQVDLIYIDPPFDSKADYKKKISLKGKALHNDASAFEEKQYTDIWSNDEYLQFMYERLILMKELLSDTGTIALHCDWHKVHYLRCIMDEVFGASNFKNEIIWCYTGATQTKSKYPSKHDNILIYTKTVNSVFNWQDVAVPYSEETIARTQRGAGDSGLYGTNEAEEKHKNRLKENGKIPEDYWTDIHRIQGNGLEKLDYPTQKPEKLLERLIKGSSNEGSIVFDCFMGSGTTQAVAMKLGRRFIGADINLGAVQTTTKRLLGIVEELKNRKKPQGKQLSINTSGNEHKIAADDEGEYITNKDPELFYTGFSVYNVNHYDVFRNPLEAKELLIKALEIQPLLGNTLLYDGEKDGRMVKIMPVNRIATKADLNELITNFDYKKFEKIAESNPNKVVESLLLVCMGHEPDLAASLQAEVRYKLDIEVVDILRDKSNLEFKRDSEAEIAVEGNKLYIKEFFPMNLLQKLSLQKENVEDWKELVDSIMIDFNYDGSVFEPQFVDIPDKNELVKGVYSIPKDAGTIRVKITDLLSESLEKTIK